MSKAVIILILLSLFFSELGYFFYYNFELSVIKKEVKKRLISQVEDKFLEHIDYTVNEENIKWEKEGKEFYFKGEMYDLVKISMQNGHIYLHCLNDKKETNLKKTANNIAKQNSSAPTSQKNKHIRKLNITKYLAGPGHGLNDLCITANLKETYRSFDEAVYSAITEKTGPPPRVS